MSLGPRLCGVNLFWFMPKSNFSWHKYIRILKTIRTNIRIYSYQKNDTNEYTNIFVSKKSIRTNIRIYSYQKNDTNMIRTNIRIGKYSNIFEYPNIRIKKQYERISEYICIKKMIRTNIRIYSYKKNDTNMIRTNIPNRKYSNIRIYSYQIIVPTNI